MNLIIAIDNKRIEDELTKIYITKYNIYIVKSKESIISMIKDDTQTILVLRDDLTGIIDSWVLLKELKSREKLITIMVVKNVDNLIKEKLYSLEVFNIINGNKLRLQDLVYCIDNPKHLESSRGSNRKKSNFIFVIGNSGSGKTIMCHLLARSLSTNNLKILVLDMDYLNPMLDAYISSPKNYSLVDYIKDVINSNIKDLKNYETIDNNNSNIRYLLNQKSIGIPKDEIILHLLQSLTYGYDYIIVDTSSFLIEKMYEIANKLYSHIIYMIEPNFNIVKSLDKRILYSSIVVLNRYREDKEFLKYINNSIDIPVKERLRKCKNISKNIKMSREIPKFIELKKEIGMETYNTFQKLVKKIVFKEEVKWQKKEN